MLCTCISKYILCVCIQTCGTTTVGIWRMCRLSREYEEMFWPHCWRGTQTKWPPSRSGRPSGTLTDSPHASRRRSGEEGDELWKVYNIMLDFSLSLPLSPSLSPPSPPPLSLPVSLLVCRSIENRRGRSCRRSCLRSCALVCSKARPPPRPVWEHHLISRVFSTPSLVSQEGTREREA